MNREAVDNIQRISVRSETTWTLTRHGEKHVGFTMESCYLGMTCFRRANERVIVDREGNLIFATPGLAQVLA